MIKANLLGAPYLTRKSEIAEKLANSSSYYQLEVMGEYQSIKVIKVRIGVPVYRISNGRTKTFQKEYLAMHPDVPSDLFLKDPESLTAQRAQHEILEQLVKDEDLLKEFKDGTHQTEPIIVTASGVVVNGNRRLCAWRNLFDSDSNKYKHFEFINIAVLPEECDEIEIVALEKRLQIQKTHRAEYKWHNKASMMKEESEAGVSIQDLAKSYDATKKEVELLIGAFEYAEIYLESIGKKDYWSLVDGDEYAFKTFVEERKKITDQSRKELFEQVIFKLIERKDYEGRLYSAIPEISKNLDQIALELRGEGLLPNASASNSSDEVSNNSNESVDVAKKAPEGLTLDEEEKVSNDLSTSNVDQDEVEVSSEDDLDLLGGDTTDKSDFSDLATAVKSTEKNIGKIIKRVNEEQKALKQEEKSAKYLIDTLAKVSKQLLNVQLNGLHENTVVDGVETQLAEIKKIIIAIEVWLEYHQSNECGDEK